MFANEAAYYKNSQIHLSVYSKAVKCQKNDCLKLHHVDYELCSTAGTSKIISRVKDLNTIYARHGRIFWWIWAHPECSDTMLKTSILKGCAARYWGPWLLPLTIVIFDLSLNLSKSIIRVVLEFNKLCWATSNTEAGVDSLLEQFLFWELQGGRYSEYSKLACAPEYHARVTDKVAYWRLFFVLHSQYTKVIWHSEISCNLRRSSLLWIYLTWRSAVRLNSMNKN